MSRKILYTSFNVWNKLENKNDYFTLSIAFTIPKYFTEYKYLRLMPSKELFFDTHKNGYNHKEYFEKYYKEISKYSPKFILKELLSLSNKQILLVGWEEINVFGECQFIIEWLYNCKGNGKAFALLNNIHNNQYEALFDI